MHAGFSELMCIVYVHLLVEAGRGRMEPELQAMNIRYWELNRVFCKGRK